MCQRLSLVYRRLHSDDCYWGGKLTYLVFPNRRRFYEVMMRPMSLLIHAAFVLSALSACQKAGLEKNDTGKVIYSQAPKETGSQAIAVGHFIHENGCLIFVTADGGRYLPILPEGAWFSVEPERILFNGSWQLEGFNQDSSTVRDLRTDPIALECGAEPAFVSNIGPAGKPPPVPPRLPDAGI